MIDKDTTDIIIGIFSIIGAAEFIIGIPYMFEKGYKTVERKTQEQIDDIRPFFDSNPLGCYEWILKIAEDTGSNFPDYVANCALNTLDELKERVMDSVGSELTNKFGDSRKYLGKTPLHEVSEIYKNTIYQREGLEY